MIPDRILSILVLTAAVAFAASPVIFPEFAGYDPDLFPIRQDDPPVQPAGWAFSIWGVIYAWLILGAGYGLWRHADDAGWRAMRLPLLASLAIGFFWIPVANRMPGLATIMILGMLATAVAAMLRAGRDAPWWQGRPVALYAGWLTAASGVSVGIWLAGFGYLGPQAAAILALVAVTGLALAVQARRPGEWAYPVAVIWALAGVVAQNWRPGNWTVIALAVIGTAALSGRILANRRASHHAPASERGRP
ncbi:tryptophan-rich sensory protein [Paracoccus aestuarii]|uniref:Tryptophan-rich sensory protein n=1 Tax=Paracoccus aestuarii TaxID=453842 RepID=A0A418ZYE7_9RHOB|nr:TspO/MBR family protein [Paracoccus aestuarii]RJL05555.1 tryptophan-rich sensory protein [Paracoccus aestuarii]WCQ99457.1 tryptophan-rich sensory protein [Paracoccus aestuarii]